MAWTSFISDNKWVILAYLILILIVYINRKKFVVENKIFLLYRTKHGVDFINDFADRHREFVKILGYTAIGVGFVGMIAIMVMFGVGLYNLIFVPGAPATVSLAIPGVQVPGSQFKIPFVYGMLSLFVVILFHEFGHGIVARANGIKIKSTGIGLLGPLPLAFVEPDEKQITKTPSHVQHSIFAAGPFFNVILCVILFALIHVLIYPVMNAMTQPTGVTFDQLITGEAAQKYGLQPGEVYTKINDINTINTDQLSTFLTCMVPNQSITFFSDKGNVTVITGTNPDNHNKGYLGVKSIGLHQELKTKNGFVRAIYSILSVFANPNSTSLADYKLLEWIFTLSLGIGLANLLPLGPVDGGRMTYTAFVDIKGKEKGAKWWGTLTWITLAVLALLLFVPIIRHFLPGF